MRKRQGEIVPIKDLFSKYRLVLKAPQKSVESEVVRVVGEVVGITLKEGQVSYTVSTRTIHMRVSGVVRQEILLRQGEILTKLVSLLGEQSAPRKIV